MMPVTLGDKLNKQHMQVQQYCKKYNIQPDILGTSSYAFSESKISNPKHIISAASLPLLDAAIAAVSPLASSFFFLKHSFSR
jgi:hypothetical protein